MRRESERITAQTTSASSLPSGKHRQQHKFSDLELHPITPHNKLFSEMTLKLSILSNWAYLIKQHTGSLFMRQKIRQMNLVASCSSLLFFSNALQGTTQALILPAQVRPYTTDFSSLRDSRDEKYFPPDFSVIDDDDAEDDGSDEGFDQYVSKDDFIVRGSAADEKEDLQPKKEEKGRSSKAYKSKDVRAKAAPDMEGTSWMQKNAVFANEDYDEKVEAPPKRNRTFRQDFRGTRVFVKGIPSHISWQDLKDHFAIAGEVVFASVSVDSITGESKGVGIVQFETSEMAENAIRIMRHHSLDGSTLFVREDVQEREGVQLKDQMPRASERGTPPSRWICADDENASVLSDEETEQIVSLIKDRDSARRRKNYEVSDKIREDLKINFGVHLDDRLKQWWVSFDGSHVPQNIKAVKGEGRWGGKKAWRQIPTTPENDACVNPDLVNGLLMQRDIARKEKDFSTADALLEEAKNAPDGDLYLRIHDESRTWRIWTDASPPRPQSRSDTRKSAAEQCIDLVRKKAPHKEEEIKGLLSKFPGREYPILKKLKQSLKDA